MARARTSPVRIVGWLAMLAGVVFATLSVVARPADADPATATIAGAPGWKSVHLSAGGSSLGEIFAGPIWMSIGGQQYSAYCIDFHGQLDTSDPATYEERTWGDGNFPNATALAKVNWILHNSYPNATAAAVATAAGVDPATADLENIVGTATQAAIWYFSDGLSVDAADAGTEIGKIVTYLTGPANVGVGEPAPADVDIVEDSATGLAGTQIGPFTIASTAGDVVLTSDNPAVGFLVNGVPQNTASDGDQVFAAVPEDAAAGAATITATGTTQVPSGRIFVHQANPDGHQKLILAAAANVDYADTAVLNWNGGSKPDAAFSKDCAQGGIVVTLSNPGAAPASFTVTNNGAPIATETVAPGGSKQVLVPLANGDAYDIDVVSGSHHFEATGTFQCDAPQPAAEAVPDCAQGGVVVTLRNTGTGEATFVVTNKGVPVGAAVKVAAGASSTVLVPVAAGETYDITAVSGAYSQTFSGELTCGESKPQLQFFEDCAAGGIQVSLVNTAGTAAATFVVTNNGNPVATVSVPAGQTRTQLVPVAEDAAYSISVSSGGTVLGTKAGVRNCTNASPDAEVSTSCVVGAQGMVVTLRNTGNQAITYTVANNGNAVASNLAVAPGATVTVLVALTDGATYNIVATPSVGTAETFTGTFICSTPSTTIPYANPGASVVDSCADNGVVVTVSNSGSLPATFVIVSGGTKVAEVKDLVGSQRVVIPVADGTGYTIRVTATGGFDQTFTGTHATCMTTTGATTTVPVTVLGTVVTTPTGPVQTVSPVPPTLPHTGGETRGFLILAMALLGLGGGLLVIQDVLGGRRKTAQ